MQQGIESGGRAVNQEAAAWSATAEIAGSFITSRFNLWRGRIVEVPR